MSDEKTDLNGFSNELSAYLAARSKYEVERNQYVPPTDIPANKDSIVGHLNTQIRGLQEQAKKYAALRDLIKKIPDNENDPTWQLLKNIVVHGTLVEGKDDPEGGPENIWLAR